MNASILSKIRDKAKVIFANLWYIIIIAGVVSGLLYYICIYDEPVYVTPYGEKYHDYRCFYLDDASYTTKYDSADDAESAGYAPCSRCNCHSGLL